MSKPRAKPRILPDGHHQNVHVTGPQRDWLQARADRDFVSFSAALRTVLAKAMRDEESTVNLPNGLSKRLTALAIEAGIPRAEYVIKLLKASVAVIGQDNRPPA